MGTHEDHAKEIISKSYPVMFQRLQDDVGEYYFGWLPDFGLSACSATGYTVPEMLENLRGVQYSLVCLMLAQGEPIPEPTDHLAGLH